MFVKAERLSQLSLFKLLLTTLSSSLFVLLFIITVCIAVLTYQSGIDLFGNAYHFSAVFLIFMIVWPILSILLSSLLWVLSAFGLWLFPQLFSIKLEFKDVIESSIKQ